MGKRVLTATPHNEITCNAGADLLTGNAGNGHARRRRRQGYEMAAAPETTSTPSTTRATRWRRWPDKGVISSDHPQHLQPRDQRRQCRGSVICRRGRRHADRQCSRQRHHRRQRGNDTLDGGAGNDILNGALGNDKMSGGTGNDTYVVTSDKDQVIENKGEGIDTVESFVSITLFDNVENLTLAGDGKSPAWQRLGQRHDRQLEQQRTLRLRRKRSPAGWRRQRFSRWRP
jgi:hypothetical protein